MKTAFLFPGQGAQTVGMGADLYYSSDIYKNTFDQCGEACGLNLKAACFEGAKMDESETVQPAIFTHSMSLLSILRTYGIYADVYAGLSLGEYSALCAADAFSHETGATLVRQRGSLMDSALLKGEGGMLAITGFTAGQIEKSILAAYPNVYIANHLSKQQLVLSGYKAQLLEIKQALVKEGACMASLLNVSGPFHSPLLLGAAKAFEKELSLYEFKELNSLVYSNSLGSPYEAATNIKALLYEQMYSRVRWHECMEHMYSMGITRFVEIGPSNVLTKLVKRGFKDAQAISVFGLASLEAFIRQSGEAVA